MSPEKKKKKKWLLRYVLCVACLAFAGRATPLAFLPLVLQVDFQQSSTAVGVIMALYPLAALVATPVAARIARETPRIVALHSIAILTVAAALMLSAAGPIVQSFAGNLAGAAWLGLCRVMQGVGASFYLSSNTCLLARKFPDQLAYAIALTEVAVGAGGQVGRLVGGFLFDFGGLSFPFVLIAGLQASLGLVGLTFEDGGGRQATSGEAGKKEPVKSKIPWGELVTTRLCVGALAAFMYYLVDCFTAATLLQYMSVHLAPTTVGEMNVAMAFRALSYLSVSYGLAQMMHRQLFSFESLVIFGSALVCLGLNLAAPQPWVTNAESTLFGGEPSRAATWAMQVLSFVVMSGGGACLFVPSLPLMQAEVRHHGQVAIEQVAELFVIMLTSGEMLGPIFGGWLVQHLGFPMSTFIFACVLVPFFAFSLASYDGAVVRARRLESRGSCDRPASEGSPDEVWSSRSYTLLLPSPNDEVRPSRDNLFLVPGDGESNFSARRLPFAIDVERRSGSIVRETWSDPAPLAAGAVPLLDDARDVGRSKSGA